MTRIEELEAALEKSRQADETAGKTGEKRLPYKERSVDIWSELEGEKAQLREPPPVAGIEIEGY
jgi:hypothetical protein